MGYISCYSEPGKGTTFSIYLPLTSEESEKLPVTEPRATTVKGREIILLVEDDDAVRRFTRSILAKEGYTVIEAAGGEEALSVMASRNADIALLVTDVVMPRMSGRDLAGELKEKYPAMEVLFLSGYTANAIVHHHILDAGLDFLQKPFSSRELLAKVRAMLDRRAG